MRCKDLRVFVAVAAIAAPVALLSPRARAQQPDQSPRPTFRTGVDVVQLDVTVLDKNRHPLRGLTAADFTVLEDGKPRPVVGAELVELPRPDGRVAPWTREVAPDVVSNQKFTGRIITIVMDDANTGTRDGMWDPWIGGTGRQIARSVVENLGPADAAAVTFAFMGTKQNFTPDRASLLKAIDSFTPKNSPSAGPPLGCQYRGDGSCLLDAIEHVADALPVLPPRRKILVLISNGAISVPELDQDAVGQRTAVGGSLSVVARIFRKLQAANITIYAFSPQGLEIRGRTQADDHLQMLAEQTGGRTTLQTNVPWEAVPVMLEETQAYYLVAFESGHSDGRFHRISLRVNRLDAEVRTRNAYFATKPADTVPRSSKPSRIVPAEDAAMSAGFPESSLPLEMTAAAFTTPGQHAATVIVLARLRPGLTPDEAAIVTFRASAFDKDWRERATDRQTLAMRSQTTDGIGTVTSTLRLNPGRYELRVSAAQGARAGSVFADLEVPDASGSRLSASGLLAGPIAEPAARFGIPAVPLVPTAARRFDVTSDVAAFVRLYQGRRRATEPVDVRMTVIDDGGLTVVTDRRQIPAPMSGAGRSADVLYRLPLDRLGAGEHLLKMELTQGKDSIVRTMRFVVERP